VRGVTVFKDLYTGRVSLESLTSTSVKQKPGGVVGCNLVEGRVIYYLHLSSILACGVYIELRASSIYIQ
jgi:hypothetical protein